MLSLIHIYVIDIGPGAGIHGGNVVAAGTPEEVMANENSLTGQYLSGKRKIEIPAKRDVYKRQVYEACKALNPDFMVYGEGWDMPSFLDSGKRASISNNAQMPYVAHFSDRFRDVVKGRTNTNEVSVKGLSLIHISYLIRSKGKTIN